MAELLYKDEAYAIIGAAMEVYNQLGHGFLEAVYQEALAIEMRTRQIPFQEQVPVEIVYKGNPLHQRYVPDLLAYDRVIIEIKAIRQLTSVEEAQIIHYLRATAMRLGLLINSGHPTGLDWKRRVL